LDVGQEARHKDQDADQAPVVWHSPTEGRDRASSQHSAKAIRSRERDMDVHKIPVILYHDVQRVPRTGIERWTVSPHQFHVHIDALAASRRVSLTISEVAECLRGERSLERDAMAVTFDDGYASTYDSVQELVRRGFSAT